MQKLLQNTLGAVACWVVVLGVGYYMTFMRQPEELKQVKDAVKVEQMKRAELTTLLQEEAASIEQAREAVSRWRSRYRNVPDTMTTPAVVDNINNLTTQGFENFDISFAGDHRTPEYNYLAYSIKGRGYFSRLYDFIWEIENSRAFYRISDLKLEHIDLTTEDRESGKKRMKVMVSFTMNLEAYYGGLASMKEPVEQLASLVESEEWSLRTTKQLVDVPKAVLPDEKPAVNPFFPGILDQLPPNTYDRIDVENAELVSIVDQEAVFKDGKGYRSVGEGDDVYLGKIVKVYPREGRVVARLNKGGIIDRVEKQLKSEEQYRHAQGANRLAPTTGR